MMSRLSLATSPTCLGDELASPQDVEAFAYCGATVGKATRCYLPDGRVTDLAMPGPKLFIARSAFRSSDWALRSTARGTDA
jgi:hypothetical protein